MTGSNVVVWGNCQAEPIAKLLAGPLARHGLTVVDVPPVFLVEPQQLQGIYDLVADAALLLSQPVRDEYRVPGCGTEQLAGHLPPGGRLVRFASAFDAAAYPFQVAAHDGDGGRIAAPLTDYHDLRIIAAAAGGVDAETVGAIWPPECGEAQLTAHAALAMGGLQARERGCDVTVSGAIRQDRGMFTIDHPSNATLAHVARGILDLLGIDERVAVPDREFLASTRTPVEAAPAGLLGWSVPEDAGWVIGGRSVSWSEVVQEHLAFYRANPGVIADTRRRFADRLELLELPFG